MTTTVTDRLQAAWNSCPSLPAIAFTDNEAAHVAEAFALCTVSTPPAQQVEMVPVPRDLLQSAIETYEGEWGEANSPAAWPNRFKAYLTAAQAGTEK